MIQIKSRLIKFFLTATFILPLQNINAQVNPNIEWQKSYGGSKDEGVFSIKETGDGGYIIAGSSNSTDGDLKTNKGGYDAWIVKIDNGGNIQWQKTYGGSKDDYAYYAQQTLDGGYVFGGITESNDGDVSGNHGGVDDTWIVKIDSSGNIQWQKCLGGSNLDTFDGMQQCSDSGYIVAITSNSTDGDITSNKGGSDAWIVKLKPNGSIAWQKSYGSNGDDGAGSVYQTPDNGYIVAASSAAANGDVTVYYGGEADFWILKIDSIGTIQWQKSFGGNGVDAPYSIKQTTDKGYVVAGITNSTNGDVTGVHNPGSGYYDIWIVKIDSVGALQWEKCYGGSSWDYAYSIKQTTDSGYIVAGETESYDGDVTNSHGISYFDCWIVKLNSSGTLQWQSAYGGTSDDGASDVLQIKDNGYLFVSSTTSTDGDVAFNHGGADIWLVKLSPLTAVKNVRAVKSYLLYPNPATNEIIFQNGENSGTITLTDVLGRRLYFSVYMPNEKLTINSSSFPQGIYLLNISNKKQSSTEEIIIE